MGRWTLEAFWNLAFLSGFSKFQILQDLQGFPKYHPQSIHRQDVMFAYSTVPEVASKYEAWYGRQSLPVCFQTADIASAFTSWYSEVRAHSSARMRQAISTIYASQFNPNLIWFGGFSCRPPLHHWKCSFHMMSNLPPSPEIWTMRRTVPGTSGTLLKSTAPDRQNSPCPSGQEHFCLTVPAGDRVLCESISAPHGSRFLWGNLVRLWAIVKCGRHDDARFQLAVHIHSQVWEIWDNQ